MQSIPSRHGRLSYQIAAGTVSPVRTRATESSGATYTLPSPMVPVPAD